MISDMTHKGSEHDRKLQDELKQKSENEERDWGGGAILLKDSGYIRSRQKHSSGSNVGGLLFFNCY